MSVCGCGGSRVDDENEDDRVVNIAVVMREYVCSNEQLTSYV